MNWKDRALQAVEAKAAREREEKRVQDEAERAKQVEAFQVALGALLDEDIPVDALEVTVEGVTFRWMYDPRGRTYGIAMQGVCPDCGASAWSGRIHTLEQLGELLQRFRPESEHAQVHLHMSPQTAYERKHDLG